MFINLEVLFSNPNKSIQPHNQCLYNFTLYRSGKVLINSNIGRNTLSVQLRCFKAVISYLSLIRPPAYSPYSDMSDQWVFRDPQ